MSVRNRTVDGLLHLGGAIVAVFMRVPVAERDVLGRHFDEADAFFDESPCEQAPKSEAARVVGVVGVSGSSVRSNAFDAGDWSRRSALSIDASRLSR